MQVLGNNGSGCDTVCTATTTQPACLNLEEYLVGGGYIASMSIAPKTGSATATDYYLQREAGGVIVVGACYPESEFTSPTPTIRVQR